MNNKIRIIIGIICVVFLTIVFIVIANIKNSNWSESFLVDNSNPFGLEIFNKEIENLLPEKKITKTSKNIYDIIIDNDSINKTLFVVQNYQFIYEEDFLDIENFISAGNDLFIVSSEIYTNEHEDNTFNKKEIHLDKPPVNLTFTDNTLKKYNNSFIYTTRFNFITSKTYNIEILSTYNDIPVYYRYKIGDGYLYFYNLPHVFSNHFLINNSVGYTSAVLSYIRHENVIFYNESFYYENEDNYVDNDYNEGILYFILSNKYLKTAWYLFVFWGICFVFFKIKRTQRIIPEIEENKNRSLEFVKTISNLYFNDKNTSKIIVKLDQQFLEKVEKKYQLKTTKLDDNFIQLLAKYSENDIQFIKNVITRIRFHENGNFSPTHQQINEHYINLKKIIK